MSPSGPRAAAPISAEPRLQRRRQTVEEGRRRHHGRASLPAGARRHFARNLHADGKNLRDSLDFRTGRLFSKRLKIRSLAVRPLRCQGRGRGFESLRPLQSREFLFTLPLISAFRPASNAGRCERSRCFEPLRIAENISIAPCNDYGVSVVMPMHAVIRTPTFLTDALGCRAFGGRSAGHRYSNFGRPSSGRCHARDRRMPEDTVSRKRKRQARRISNGPLLRCR